MGLIDRNRQEVEPEEGSSAQSNRMLMVSAMVTPFPKAWQQIQKVILLDKCLAER